MKKTGPNSGHYAWEFEDEEGDQLHHHREICFGPSYVCVSTVRHSGERCECMTLTGLIMVKQAGSAFSSSGRLANGFLSHMGFPMKLGKGPER